MRAREWKKRIGDSIQTARLLKGLTQEELSARLRKQGFARCSRCLLSKIESGVSVIRGHEIFYVRLVLGSEFEELFWRPVRKVRKDSK